MSLLALLLALPGSLAAQGRADGRLERAVALQDSLARADRATAAQATARAAVGRSGPVVLMLRNGTDPAAAVARVVHQAFEDLGRFADSAMAQVVLVEEGVAEPNALIGGRRAVVFGRPGGAEASERNFVPTVASNAIWSLSGVLFADTVFGAWLEHRFDPRTEPPDLNQGVAVHLAQGQWRSARGCFADRAADCVVYLGLERTVDYATRYPPDDIRRTVQLRFHRLFPQARACVDGSDSACAELWKEKSPPSPWAARYGFVKFAQLKYGPATLGRLIADTSSNVGARFSHATGRSVEVLAQEWRTWMLANLRHTAVQPGAAQAGVGIFVAALLMVLAARTGRVRE